MSRFQGPRVLRFPEAQGLGASSLPRHGPGGARRPPSRPRRAHLSPGRRRAPRPRCPPRGGPDPSWAAPRGPAGLLGRASAGSTSWGRSPRRRRVPGIGRGCGREGGGAGGAGTRARIRAASLARGGRAGPACAGGGAAAEHAAGDPSARAGGGPRAPPQGGPGPGRRVQGQLPRAPGPSPGGHRAGAAGAGTVPSRPAPGPLLQARCGPQGAAPLPCLPFPTSWAFLRPCPWVPGLS